MPRVAQELVGQFRIDVVVEGARHGAAEQGLVSIFEQTDDEAHAPITEWPAPPHAASRTPSRSRRFITVETCQRPPRRVSMPRVLSSHAIALRLVMPPDANVLDHRREVLRMPVRVARDGRPEGRTALAGPPERRRSIGVAEAHTAAPGHRQRLLGAPGDRLALLLRHQGHDPDGEVVRLWQIDRREPHAAVAQRQQEGGVARQPVELGDHQRRPGDLRQMQRLAELRPVGIAAALHLGEASEERAVLLRDEALDRLPLRLHPEPARPWRAVLTRS